MSKCDEKSHLHIFKSEEEKGGIPSGHGLWAGGRTGASSLSSSPTLAATGSAPLLRNDVLICQHTIQHCPRTDEIHTVYAYQNVYHGGSRSVLPDFTFHSTGDAASCIGCISLAACQELRRRCGGTQFTLSTTEPTYTWINKLFYTDFYRSRLDQIIVQIIHNSNYWCLNLLLHFLHFFRL